MAAMDFKKGSFDLLWSEGAVFVIGFKRALDEWKPLLRPEGFLVISELVWFKKRVPSKIRKFFTEQYPDMKYYEDILPMIESSGYKIIDYSPLPSESWWQNYYTPIENKIAELRLKYRANDKAKTVFDMLQLEIDMFRKYSPYYGYYFYIMQKK
jgi:SAM-dependent methyltransferase